MQGLNIRGRIYRIVMRIAHRFNWHYAPPVYPEGDKMLWCKWCGFREVKHRPLFQFGLAEVRNVSSQYCSKGKS